MSKFEKIIDSVGEACEKAVKVTAKLTDVAATKVKIKAEEARLGDRYETLGRLSEGYLRDKDEIPEQIAKALDEMTNVKKKISALEEELSEKKAKHAKDDGTESGAESNAGGEDTESKE